MPEFHKKLLYLTISVLIIVSTIFLIVSIKDKIKPIDKRTLPINTEGRVKVVPDVAIISLTVITEGDEVKQIQDENASKINEVTGFLKSQKIDEKDIKTINFNLTPRYYYPYDYPRIPCPPILSKLRFPCPPVSAVIIGYTLTQTVEVKVRDFSKIGVILAEAVNRGVNQIGGVQFTIEDIDKFKKQAREEAFKKANGQAEELANLGGFKIKRVLSINEGQIYIPQPYPLEAQALTKGGAPVSPELQPGTQEVTVNLTVVFEIK